MKTFSQTEFQEFIGETIPQQLFHVMPEDIDDETGVRCDEIILFRLLSQNPQALKHRPLSWFVEQFITNN